LESTFRSGYVAIMGEPNVGKSTLMNRLLQERLAIVTAKPQTTRRRTLGILSGPGYQMILLDTPGLVQPRYDLHHAMLREAEAALGEADLILFLVEPSTRVEPLSLLAGSGTPKVLALNKVDRVRNKARLLPLIGSWNATGLFREIVPISALEGTGVSGLVDLLAAMLPEGPPLYPEDQLTDQPERFFVAEIIRERIFELYAREVPYATEVSVQAFEEHPGAKDFIEAWIHVEHESQKGILIGRDGAALRRLGEEAREEIEAFLGRPVFLSLRVRVLPRWRRNPESLRRLGYRRS
jgi:GTP-binding protein Era